MAALTTDGGAEFCGKVIRDATRQLDWGKGSRDLRCIFIAGNEPFTQGEVDYRAACKAAADKGLGIVTMKSCKSLTPGRDYWPRAGEQHLAKLGEGNPFQASIRWSLSHDFVTSVLVSMQNYDQANTDIAAAEPTPA